MTSSIAFSDSISAAVAKFPRTLVDAAEPLAVHSADHIRAGPRRGYRDRSIVRVHV